MQCLWCQLEKDTQFSVQMHGTELKGNVRVQAHRAEDCLQFYCIMSEGRTHDGPPRMCQGFAHDQGRRRAPFQGFDMGLGQHRRRRDWPDVRMVGFYTLRSGQLLQGQLFRICCVLGRPPDIYIYM